MLALRAGEVMMVREIRYAVQALRALVLCAVLIPVSGHAQDSLEDVPIIPIAPTETPQQAAQDLVRTMGSRDLIAITRLEIARRLIELANNASANKAAAGMTGNLPFNPGIKYTAAEMKPTYDALLDNF